MMAHWAVDPISAVINSQLLLTGMYGADSFTYRSPQPTSRAQDEQRPAPDLTDCPRTPNMTIKRPNLSLILGQFSSCLRYVGSC